MAVAPVALTEQEHRVQYIQVVVAEVPEHHQRPVPVEAVVLEL
jgi:hypothetical protein